jgi:hypothetical protein
VYRRRRDHGPGPRSFPPAARADAPRLLEGRWGEGEAEAGPFTLTDRGTGARHRVAPPTPHGWAGRGPASPDGRLLAVEFADVSWSRVKGQVSDVWLLVLQARRWRRLPGMPLITAVKFMSMAWTGDGRLVLAGELDRFGEAVATWRPGQDHLAVRRLDLPEPDGSDSFVVWPAAGSAPVVPCG